MGYAIELLDYWRENPPTHISVFNAWFERPKPATLRDVVSKSREIGLSRGKARKAPQFVIDALKKARLSHAGQ